MGCEYNQYACVCSDAHIAIHTASIVYFVWVRSIVGGCPRFRFMDDTTDVAQRCMHPPHGLSPCTGTWTFTAAEQLEFVNATMLHLEQVLSSMDAKGKTAIVSTEVTKDSAPLNASVFDAMLLRHGALHYNEFFTGSEEDVQTALKLVAQGTPFMVHSAGPNLIGPFSAREYCLAAFLIVAGEYSYWGMGSGWSTTSFPWYPEYDRPLGHPIGAAQSFGSGRYFRAFEHLNVTLDTAQKTAEIQWHGLGPVPQPPLPPPPPPPPPPAPTGSYTAVKGQWAIHQNPPSYSDDKGFVCVNQTFDGCVSVLVSNCHTANLCCVSRKKNFTVGKSSTELHPKMSKVCDCASSLNIQDAAAACDVLAGCTSFSVISKLYQGKIS